MSVTVDKGDGAFSLNTFLAPMKSVQSVEALDVWKAKTDKISTVFMEEARNSSDDSESYKHLHEASQTLVSKCNEIYDERVKELPKSVEITKKVLWSGGGLGLAVWNIVSLFTATIPGANIILGVSTLAYAALKFFSRAKNTAKNTNIEQTFSQKAETGVRLASALGEVSLGVIGVISLAGGLTLAPYLAIPLAILGLGAVGMDMFFQGRDMLKIKKDIKKTKRDSEIQLSHIDETVSQVKKSGIDGSFLHRVLANTQKLFWDHSAHHGNKKPYEYSHHKKHNISQNTVSESLLPHCEPTKLASDLEKISVRMQ